jgi:hypothetical protein
VPNPILVVSLYPNPVAQAAQRAAMLAQALDCRTVEFLSVMSQPAPSEGGEARHVSLARCMNDVKTASAAALLGFGMRCSAGFEFGGLVESSLRRASQAAPGLIAMAWQAHPWWPVLHNFNLMRELSRGSMCPTLLVRQPPRRPYAHAVFASDFSCGSLATLKAAARLLPGARITIVHTYQVPGEGHMRAAGVRNDAIDACRRSLEREVKAAYARTAEELAPDGARLTLAMLPRPTGLSVTNYVNAVGADLVILSGSQRWLVDEWCWQARARDLIGKTASDLLMITTKRRM